jgi:hypothetical protein
MSRFLKLVFGLMIVIGFATASFAQDDANMPHPNTKAGSAAWLFTINGLGNFGLGGFTIGPAAAPVMAAGWKWYFADDMALRALLGFNTTSSGDEDPTKSPNGKNSSTAFGIGVGVEMHTHAVYSTSPYFGAQLTFASSSTDKKITPTGGTTTETKTSASTFGLGVLAGFDWYFTRGIAIGGEYMLGFGTSSSSATSGSTTVDSPSETNIGISYGGNVHLVVHF